MQFPPIKKGGNPAAAGPGQGNPSDGAGAGGNGGGGGGNQYVKNIKKNPQNQT